MPTRLSGIDAAFLHLETRTVHMHVASAIILDPSTAPRGTLHVEELKEHIGSRLHLAPMFRRRLQPVPLRLSNPVWIDDPEFDLDHHVHRVVLPTPGGMDDLAELMDDFMSRPLDRDRPLWEVWLIEGLADGRVALCTKSHHAVVDGVSGVELLAAILETSPEPEPPPPGGDREPEEAPSGTRLLLDAGRHLASRPWKALGVARQLTESATGLLWLNRQGVDLPPPPFTAPMTVFNGAIGPRRRVAFARVSLDEVKDVKNTFDTTVNDVLLAGVAGALRAYLHEHDEPVDSPLVAMVPISTHVDSTGGGNQVSAMLVGLPTHLDDPLERLRAVSESTASAKQQHGALGAETIQQVAELAPAGVFSMAARLYTRARAADRHRPIWNLVVSNVPGPRVGLYCAGARLEEIYPIGPVHETSGLNVTLFSYGSTVHVGLNADADMVPDVGVIGQRIQGSVAELVQRLSR